MCDGRFDLTGRVVIITGGAGLLGEQYALALSRSGAHVVVADVKGEAAERVASAVEGAKAISLEVDVTDPAAAIRMVEATLSAFGHVDGLVNNAALDPKFSLVHADEHTTSFERYPLGLWNRAIAVNLTGMFLCSQAVAPAMLSGKRGVIVNVCSTYGLVGPDQRLYQPARQAGPRTYKPVTYSVTKSAVLGLTRYLATYFAGQGIRVNALTPGGVYDGHDEEFMRQYSWRTPLGRMANRDEYSGAMIFLLSDASSYMTGANLVVDGGWTAW